MFKYFLSSLNIQTVKPVRIALVGCFCLAKLAQQLEWIWDGTVCLFVQTTEESGDLKKLKKCCGMLVAQMTQFSNCIVKDRTYLKMMNIFVITIANSSFMKVVLW